MKKIIFKSLFLLAAFSMCSANNAQFTIKETSLVKNVHGVVESGTWFNFILQNSVTSPISGQSSTQNFTAKLASPIYNKNFLELLIPVQTITTKKSKRKHTALMTKVTAGAILNGSYINDGDKCRFLIKTISFNDTEIEFKPGAYSTVNASLPNQSECNSKLNYSSGQLLEFQIKVDIPNLYPIRFDKNLKELSTQDNYVQAYGNSDYVITGITKFTNGFMQVAVKFYDNDIKDKLVPVFYDEFDIPHQINFLRVEGQQSRNFSTSTYLLGADYQKFGFGILE